MRVTERFIAKAVTNFIRLRENEERDDRRGTHTEVPPVSISELACDFQVTIEEATRLCRRLAAKGLIDMNDWGFIFEPEKPTPAAVEAPAAVEPKTH
jgi:hypothetical protein